jgi:Double-stranded RNA binding motif
VIDQYKNPVMSLNELKPGLTYVCSEMGSTPSTKRFSMKVTIDDEYVFEGTGASKKLAKQACARVALSTLYNVSFTPTVAPPPSGQTGTPTNGDSSIKLVIGSYFQCCGSGMLILDPGC